MLTAPLDANRVRQIGCVVGKWGRLLKLGLVTWVRWNAWIGVWLLGTAWIE